MSLMLSVSDLISENSVKVASCMQREKYIMQ